MRFQVTFQTLLMIRPNYQLCNCVKRFVFLYPQKCQLKTITAASSCWNTTQNQTFTPQNTPGEWAKCSHLEKSSKKLEKFYHFNTNMNLSSNVLHVFKITADFIKYNFSKSSNRTQICLLQIPSQATASAISGGIIRWQHLIFSSFSRSSAATKCRLDKQVSSSLCLSPSLSSSLKAALFISAPTSISNAFTHRHTHIPHRPGWQPLTSPE